MSTEDEDLTEKIWQGDKNAIKETRKKAKRLREKSLFLDAHAVMLSAYISFFKQQNIITKCFWLTSMSYHAFVIYKYHDKLNYSQINVLISFLLKLKLGRNLFFPKQTNILADKSLYLTENSKTALPSEKALILSTKALVILVTKSGTTDKVKELIHEAIGYEALILTYENSLQGYRQFVRVLRKVGEMYGLMNDTNNQIKYLKKARDLALGNAQTTDQANKIQSLLTELGVED
ncbi:MAG: hypothetical protein R3B60_05090 [Candidatus Paceibacterota bacterium]